MSVATWLRTYGLDAAYLGVGLAALVRSPAATPLGVGAVGFAALLLVADWAELRVRLAEAQRASAALAVGTVATLSVWAGLPVVADADLQLYFALAGGVFFVQAGRDVALFGHTPIELLRSGYPNLVGVCLVCAALADPLIQFRVALFGIVAGTFLVRKAFVWRGLFEG